MKYRVKLRGGMGPHDCGQGEDGQPIMARPGEAVVVEKPLHDLFPDKFDLLEEVPDAVPESAPAPAPKAAGKKAAKGKGGSEAATPIDVTDKFPSAGTAGLIVQQIGTTYSILRGEEVKASDLANESLVVTEIDEIAAEEAK